MFGDMDPFGRTFNRLLAVFGLSLVFVATASIISPRTSNAGPAGAPSVAEGAIIGRLIGTDYEVIIHATGQGPRYSVLDLKGSSLGENLTIDQLGKRFAGLDVMVTHMTQTGGSAPVRMGVVDETLDHPLMERH